MAKFNLNLEKRLECERVFHTHSQRAFRHIVRRTSTTSTIIIIITIMDASVTGCARKTLGKLTATNRLMMVFLLMSFLSLLNAPQVRGQEEEEEIISFGRPPGGSDNSLFSPIVTATCRAGVMTIKVQTLLNFVGVVHSRDYRKPECSGYGENSKVTFLRVNMLAEKGDEDYCGIFFNQVDSDERSVAVAIRTHRTLELVDDKFYMITCGKAGFQNTRNQTSLVNLQLLRNNKKVEQVVYGREYTLRADISHPDGKFGMKVKRCFSFSDTNNTVQLVDENGCPEKNIMSPFVYDKEQGRAEAKLYSMFKFPDSNRVHFQCDILVCKDDCPAPVCDGVTNSNSTDVGSPTGQARSFEPRADALLQPPEDGALMASYSVFVVEPGAQVDVDSVCTDCGLSPPWLLYLCIAFGILFLIMLIINVFLCSAMTCSCARTDSVDKEPSIIEEFDPYTRSWQGSQYGSRFSLNGHIKPIPPPLISVDTAHSISSSSECGMPAVYGVPVHSRPSSRYSNRSHKRPQHSSSSGGSTTHYSKYSNGRHIVK